MRRLLLLSFAGLILVLLAGLGQSQNPNDPYAGHIASTDPRTPAAEKTLAHRPPGSGAHPCAPQPHNRTPPTPPSAARARLWVTDPVESPFPAPADRKPRDTVKILDDIGDDGRARKVTTFADAHN